MAADSLVVLPCPLCGARDGHLPLRITGVDLHVRKYGAFYGDRKLSEWKACGQCGFVHQNPRPSSEALAQFYLNGEYHEPEMPASVADYRSFAQWYFEEKVAYAARKSGLRIGRVLEIGCGLGGALQQFASRGWAALGVEPDPAQARFAKDQLGLAGVRQGLLDDAFRLDSPVDLAFSNHAFEHLADLDSVMRALARSVKPGGYVFTAVPTYFSNRSQLSKQWMNSSHYSLFTHQSLNQLHARYGFEEICHTYRGWHKEIDDLWHVAKFTGKAMQPAAFFEDARSVQRYVNVINPLRSVLFAPVYSNYAARVQAAAWAARLWASARRSPVDFLRKALKRCARAVTSRH
jgi:SAM-dependent methyltransferase